MDGRREGGRGSERESERESYHDRLILAQGGHAVKRRRGGERGLRSMQKFVVFGCYLG